MKTEVFYIICTTPRSGSNLLCNLLSLSGRMGNPMEFFNPSAMMHPFSRKHDLISTEGYLSMSSYISEVVDLFSSENKVFGTKLLFDQFQPLLASNSFRDFVGKFKFIWLTRQDIVSQAVSLHIARQTNRWIAYTESDNQNNVDHLIEYDEFEISKCLNLMSSHNQKWLEFFTINEIDYFHLTYEDLVADSKGLCESICKFCDIEVTSNFSLEAATLVKQSTSFNNEFSMRFRKDSKLNLVNKSYDEGIVVGDLKLKN